MDKENIRKIKTLKKQKRLFGVLKGKLKIAKDFDAPLPDEILSDFEKLKCDCIIAYEGLLSECRSTFNVLENVSIAKR